MCHSNSDMNIKVLLRKGLITSIVAVVAAMLGSCVADPEGGWVELPEGHSEHTLVMYMFADNNLRGDMIKNIISAEKGLAKSMPSARVVVYIDMADSTVLCQMRHLPYGAEEHIHHFDILKEYPNQDSSDPAVMRAVMADVRNLAPSESYGLVVSGHGTGWFPIGSVGTSYNDQRVVAKPGVEPSGVGAEYTFPHLGEGSMTRFVGYDNYNSDDSMTSAELVDGLREMHFDYILFDACFMGSVEFVYDLRTVADYIVASPVEVMSAGMPYEDIVPLMFAPGRDICKVAEKVVDVYVNTGFSTKRSVAMVVVDCAKLDQLAECMAYIYRCAKGDSDKGCVEVLAEKVNVGRLQQLDRVVPTAFYDLEDLGLELCGGNRELEAMWLNALSEAIVYSGHSDDIWSARSAYDYWWIEQKVDGVLDLCGLSGYLPIASAPITAKHYFESNWAKKVYGEPL